MSILDKQLSNTPIHPSRWKPILIIGALLAFLMLVFACINVSAVAAFVDHYFTPPAHFTYHGHTSYVSAVAWSPDGRRIASAGGDGTVQVWDTLTGGHVYTYRGHHGDVFAVAWSPDGTRLASGGLDDTVHVWEATPGHRLATYHGHIDAVYALAWSPDGRRIASGSRDGTIQVWNATTGGHLMTYANPISIGSTDFTKAGPSPWNAVTWSPDGKRIAGGTDGDLVVLDAISGKHLASYGYHGGTGQAVAWSPHGRYLAVGRSDNTVQVWDVANGRNVYTYYGHTSVVLAVAWSPDGRRIASGSNDGTVQVWDALTGGHVYTYRGHADVYWGHFTFGSGGAVNSVAWSPDGRHIVSGSSDTTVQVWRAP